MLHLLDEKHLNASVHFGKCQKKLRQEQQHHEQHKQNNNNNANDFEQHSTLLIFSISLGEQTKKKLLVLCVLIYARLNNRVNVNMIVS